MEQYSNRLSGKIDVAYVANLARLELAPGEAAEFEGQLKEVVQYVAKIGELDLSGVEPTSHAVNLENVVREDKPEMSLDREQVLANAPERIDEHFKVPRIIE